MPVRKKADEIRFRVTYLMPDSICAFSPPSTMSTKEEMSITSNQT